MVSAIGRPASSGVSERSDVARAREAEIQERLKKVELAQIQKRLQLEQQEQELKRKRILQEAADAHQRAEMEASLQKAALDDLEWERRNDFNDHPDAPEDKEVHAPEMAVNAGSDHDKKSSGHSCTVFSKSIPKVTLPQFSGKLTGVAPMVGVPVSIVGGQPGEPVRDGKNGASSGFSDRAGEEDDRRVHV